MTPIKKNTPLVGSWILESLDPSSLILKNKKSIPSTKSLSSGNGKWSILSKIVLKT
jgi:hypothetical protein